jgi:hypothetical protein
MQVAPDACMHHEKRNNDSISDKKGAVALTIEKS